MAPATRIPASAPTSLAAPPRRLPPRDDEPPPAPHPQRGPAPRRADGLPVASAPAAGKARRVAVAQPAPPVPTSTTTSSSYKGRSADARGQGGASRVKPSQCRTVPEPLKHKPGTASTAATSRQPGAAPSSTARRDAAAAAAAPSTVVANKKRKSVAVEAEPAKRARTGGPQPSRVEVAEDVAVRGQGRAKVAGKTSSRSSGLRGRRDQGKGAGAGKIEARPSKFAGASGASSPERAHKDPQLEQHGKVAFNADGVPVVASKKRKVHALVDEVQLENENDDASRGNKKRKSNAARAALTPSPPRRRRPAPAPSGRAAPAPQPQVPAQLQRPPVPGRNPSSRVHDVAHRRNASAPAPALKPSAAFVGPPPPRPPVPRPSPKFLPNAAKREKDRAEGVKARVPEPTTALYRRQGSALAGAAQPRGPLVAVKTVGKSKKVVVAEPQPQPQPPRAEKPQRSRSTGQGASRGGGDVESARDLRHERYERVERDERQVPRAATTSGALAGPGPRSEAAASAARQMALVRGEGGAPGVGEVKGRGGGTGMERVRAGKAAAGRSMAEDVEAQRALHAAVKGLRVRAYLAKQGPEQKESANSVGPDSDNSLVGYEELVDNADDDVALLNEAQPALDPSSAGDDDDDDELRERAPDDALERRRRADAWAAGRHERGLRNARLRAEREYWEAEWRDLTRRYDEFVASERAAREALWQEVCALEEAARRHLATLADLDSSASSAAASDGADDAQPSPRLPHPHQRRRSSVVHEQRQGERASDVEEEVEEGPAGAPEREQEQEDDLGPVGAAELDEDDGAGEEDGAVQQGVGQAAQGQLDEGEAEGRSSSPVQHAQQHAADQDKRVVEQGDDDGYIFDQDFGGGASSSSPPADPDRRRASLDPRADHRPSPSPSRSPSPSPSPSSQPEPEPAAAKRQTVRQPAAAAAKKAPQPAAQPAPRPVLPPSKARPPAVRPPGAPSARTSRTGAAASRSSVEERTRPRPPPPSSPDSRAATNKAPRSKMTKAERRRVFGKKGRPTQCPINGKNRACCSLREDRLKWRPRNWARQPSSSPSPSP
ncbi:uncharacterized protein RHOBADRAFT_45728 [Rhodotorula graminis WP1]|uniref:Uncharacterized protein n=1 Tax=Rhodotorula graminis (strain WP1) TaxID=578459 RepID=A0A0P9ENS1_RHOGW|nr:uncharacterized protein RHOBADRAFT_45728 [Rhodotorula graminis WP1]KPV73771.1 hypothetical protein RHOBADRAFT_45728 [Rhodotorula graminis WP1]